jgi:hypothetical protein
MGYLIFVIGVIVFIIALSAGLSRRKRRKVLHQIARTVGGVIANGKVAATHGAIQYHCEYGSGGEDAPHMLTIAIACPSVGEFVVSRTEGIDRLAKKLGLYHALQCGDPQFSKDFYVETDAVAFASAFFAAPEKRQSVRELFRLGCSSVRHDQCTMQATWVFSRLEQLHDVAFIPPAVGALERLATQLLVSSPPAKANLPGWQVTIRGLVVGSVGFLLSGISLFAIGSIFFPPLDAWDFFVGSALYSLFAFALLSAFLTRLVRGKPWGHRALVGTLCMLVVVVPFAGYGTAMILNGWLDAAAVRRLIR